MIGIILQGYDLIDVITRKELADKLISKKPEVVFIDVKQNGGTLGRKFYKETISQWENIKAHPVFDCFFMGAHSDYELLQESNIPLDVIMVVINGNYQDQFVEDYAHTFANILRGKDTTIIICSSLAHLKKDGTAYKLGELLVNKGIKIKICPLVTDKNLDSVPYGPLFALSIIMTDRNYESVLDFNQKIFFWSLRDYLEMPNEFVPTTFTLENKYDFYYNISDLNLSIYADKDKRSDIIGKIKPGESITISGEEAEKNITWGITNSLQYVILKENGVTFFDVRS